MGPNLRRRGIGRRRRGRRRRDSLQRRGRSFWDEEVGGFVGYFHTGGLG